MLLGLLFVGFREAPGVDLCLCSQLGRLQQQVCQGSSSRCSRAEVCRIVAAVSAVQIKACQASCGTGQSRLQESEGTVGRHFPVIPWSLCPAEYHHSPSDIPSTSCLSSGLLGFCLDAGNQLLVCCFGAREGLCTCSLLLAGLSSSAPGSCRGAAAPHPSLHPLADAVQAGSVSSPIPWPLTEQGVLTLGYPALFQVRAAWGNPR